MVLFGWSLSFEWVETSSAERSQNPHHLKAALWSLPMGMLSKILLIQCHWWTDVKTMIQMTEINRLSMEKSYEGIIHAISSFEMTQYRFNGRWNTVLLLVFCCFWVPFLPVLARILCLLLSPRVQLMGCRKHWAPELTVCIMCLVTEIPNYIPSPSLTC